MTPTRRASVTKCHGTNLAPMTPTNERPPGPGGLPDRRGPVGGICTGYQLAVAVPLTGSPAPLFAPKSSPADLATTERDPR